MAANSLLIYAFTYNFHSNWARVPVYHLLVIQNALEIIQGQFEGGKTGG